MKAALAEALGRLRARGARTVVAATGILAGGLMLGTAATVSYSLATGFDRAAREADTPDLIARFDPRAISDVDRRIRALPNTAAVSYRYEVGDVPLEARGRVTGKGSVVSVSAGRRGYGIRQGHDLTGADGEVVVEQGFAHEFGLHVGDRLDVGRLGPHRVVGISLSPDNVAFPLASAARVYLSLRAVERIFGQPLRDANELVLWARDPARLDATLVQARAVTFGVRNLRFLTKAGVRVVRDQAAGIVISLMIAFSLVAVGAAGLMLGSAARADVERRLQAIGVMRAVGFSRGEVTRRFGLDALIVALPAGAAGVGLGALLAQGPSGALLGAINELPPGAGLLIPLAAALALLTGVVWLTTVWPAWRAAGRLPARLLRGAELRGGATRLATRLPSGMLGLGLRMVVARPVRTAGAALVLAAATAVILLMLALASLLQDLRSNPASVGKRYQLTIALPASNLPLVRAVPGVEVAVPRYSLAAADSFELGETMTLIGIPGDHTRIEGPPLAEGRRVRASDEAEIGEGLANAIGVHTGGVLAAQLPTGREARFRVVGVVRALANDGRVAYVQPPRLVAAQPDSRPPIAVRLAPGADRGEVSARLARLGATPVAVGGATTSNAGFFDVLAGVLRVVAIVNGLVGLYALIQTLTLTALERRATLALLRATGAGRSDLAWVFGGAAAALLLIAAPVGVLLARYLLGPAVGRLAADYADLSPVPGGGQVALVVVGLGAMAGLASVWVARRTEREPVAQGLRDE